MARAMACHVRLMGLVILLHALDAYGSVSSLDLSTSTSPTTATCFGNRNCALDFIPILTLWPQVSIALRSLGIVYFTCPQMVDAFRRSSVPLMRGLYTVVYRPDACLRWCIGAWLPHVLQVSNIYNLMR
ncbi:hypothetical protein BS47DRAFT_1353038 [Hydnum rufescens UP504]|uniref:Secreted protein n=1 Tax=Hydnum rufescens UP504 TaxID=1448309 RepID=A0A9P6DQ20_9AGAM|nr:hypothetical protein BS47DRAFT_1353038 [Hydnum rufescens UP504]